MMMVTALDFQHHTIITKKDCETYYPIDNRNEYLDEISLLYANVEHYDLLYYNK